MIADKTILGVIPARGGSKGIPRKNIMNVAGKPLIAWTIEEALKSKYIDRLILSSDDEEIIQIAMKWGCDAPFVRPSELAQDDTPGVAPLLHAIGEVTGFDYVVLLQPTSPLRTVEDIDGCIELCISQYGDTSVTVTKVEKSPTWMYRVNLDFTMSPYVNTEFQVKRRQDADELYVLNGAVYVAQCKNLIKRQTLITSNTKGFIMPGERSFDIDSEYEMIIVEALLLRRQEVN